MPRWGSAACALFTMTATGLSPAASPSASASPVMRLISGAGPSGISGLAPGAEAEDALCVPDEVLSPHAVMPNASITASAKAIMRFTGFNSFPLLIHKTGSAPRAFAGGATRDGRGSAVRFFKVFQRAVVAGGHLGRIRGCRARVIAELSGLFQVHHCKVRLAGVHLYAGLVALSINQIQSPFSSGSVPPFRR